MTEGRVLIAGWYSFEGYGATAGDVMVRDVVWAWLAKAGLQFDVAVAPPLTDGIDFSSADPHITTPSFSPAGRLATAPKSSRCSTDFLVEVFSA